ncbi:MAG: FkbM family methyltransferase [Candidatus Aminicenantes bacterium]|nr:FkbM family methyltransferase [Candidatus Aminicenantes bacterium]
MSNRLVKKALDLKKLFQLLGLLQTVAFLMRNALGRSLISVKLKGIKTRVWIRPKRSDIYALSHIFRKSECDIPFPFSPSSIVDGGAYAGYSTVFFANKYPQARIVAIEPDRNNYELLIRNCRSYKKIVIIRAGLWSSVSDLRIANPQAESWAYKLTEATADVSDRIPGVTLKEIMAQHRWEQIDILKLDIEGSEKVLFSSRCEEWIDNVKVIIMELHGEDCESAVMKGLGGRKFRMSHQGEKLILVKDMTSFIPCQR